LAKYKRVKEQGITFLFKYQEEAPELLHIYVRHLTTVDDALDVYFTTTSKWYDERKRYENYSKTHGIHWFWLNEFDKVMMITCFRLGEE
jgi:hypothetical protein